MSEQAFKIETDLSRNYLRLTYTGFLAVTQLAPLEREVDAAFASLIAAGHPRGSHRTMVDLINAGVQSQEVAVCLQRLAARVRALSRRVAILMPNSMLTALQIKRTVPEDAYATFHDEKDAFTWLLNGDGSSA